jgi:hypothetical protein
MQIVAGGPCEACADSSVDAEKLPYLSFFQIRSSNRAQFETIKFRVFFSFFAITMTKWTGRSDESGEMDETERIAETDWTASVKSLDGG